MKTEMENLKNEKVFENFEKMLEVQMLKFDLVDKIIPKTKKMFKEVTKLTEKGVEVLKFLIWCFSKVRSLKNIRIISASRYTLFST